MINNFDLTKGESLGKACARMKNCNDYSIFRQRNIRVRIFYTDAESDYFKNLNSITHWRQLCMNSFHVYSQIEFFTAIYNQRYFEINYKVLFHIGGSCTKIKFERVIFNSIKKSRASVLYFSNM